MEKYYLGLDMGTNSVGWAVTDENYNLVRKKGKDLWGVREFERANTSAERRSYRTSRRRRQRELVRIGLLKSYFEDAIESVDPNFYARLDNSKYLLEDKNDNVRTPNGIFADNAYDDKAYYDEYPTIFHLRNKLIKDDEIEYDVRLVFLALLHMFKNRGHFLNPGVSSDETLNMDEAVQNLSDILENELDISLISVNAKDIEKILGSRKMSRSDKAIKLQELFEVNKSQKQLVAILKTICGLKGDAKVLFDITELDDKVEIQFSDFNYEEKESSINEAVGDELFEIVKAMKSVYDIGVLSSILNGHRYISESKVSDYDKHREDLKCLKHIVRKYGTQEQYDSFFRSENPGSYSAYVGSNSYSKIYEAGNKSKHRRNMKDGARDKFYKNLQKLLEGLSINKDEDNKIREYIISEIKLESFLPKQKTPSNGVVPYQVNEMEMKAILKNASRYLEFLNDKDESGLTVSERILKLFSFQIPYYIGPLSSNSKTGWVVRKEPGDVLPWNFEEKINTKKTAEEFVSRMVRRCTYIRGEQVLPKESLIYQKYCVLNEINNIRIDNERIPVELKQDLYNDLFKIGKKVSKSKIVSYFKCRGVIDDEIQLSGIDVSVNSSLSSYGKIRSVFGDDIDTDAGVKKAEDVIFWCTVYGDSKSFLRQSIKEKYPELDEKQIKRLLGMKFNGWGKLSKSMLCLEGINPETGEICSLINAMWESNYNLMELLHNNEFGFGDALNTYETQSLSNIEELSYDMLDEYYFSAPIKRMVWQTIKLIKEIESIMGLAPERVFVEMTRSDEEKGEKGRKSSRGDKLKALYKNIKDETYDWNKLIDDVSASGKIRSKKMYLYITQMGKDIYTGEPIDIDELFGSDMYDIDHIYPRHFIKDDSIHNNLVLTRKQNNAHKSDNYPLESSIRNSEKVRKLWGKLSESELITKEKYRRLTGNKPFSDEQKAGFIARQLVETGQATKGIAEILKSVTNSEIVYTKASNVSDFRRRYELFKARALNDNHHAHDAYLNIVVGNAYLTKFTKNPINYIKNEYAKNPDKNNYNLSKMFEKDIKRNDIIAWKASEKDKETGTIVCVKRTLSRNTPMITEMIIDRNGSLFNITINGGSKAKDKNYVPIKTSDSKLRNLQKYGGYTSVKPAYLFVVEHGSSKSRKISFEGVPVMAKSKIRNEADLKEFCVKDLKLVDPVIIAKKINLHSLLKFDGYYVRVVGIDSSKKIELHNAVSLCLNQKWANYIKRIENSLKEGRVNQYITEQMNLALYDELVRKHQNTIFNKKPKTSGDMLHNGKDKFIKLSLYEQCDVLVKVLGLSRLGTTNEKLKMIGGSDEEGRMRISGNISNKPVSLISQSITGLYSREIVLSDGK